jgi:hypothetical protein
LFVEDLLHAAPLTWRAHWMKSGWQWLLVIGWIPYIWHILFIKGKKMHWNWYHIFKNISNLHCMFILTPAMGFDLTGECYGTFWCLVYSLCILFVKTIKSLFYIINKNNKHFHGWASWEMVNCNLFYNYKWKIVKGLWSMHFTKTVQETCKYVWPSFKTSEIYYLGKRQQKIKVKKIAKVKTNKKTKVNLIISTLGSRLNSIKNQIMQVWQKC